MLGHCRALIDATAQACVAVKLQLACFERLGAPGLERARGGGRPRARARPARDRRRQAGRHRGERRRLRAGAARRHRDARSAAVRGLGADLVTVNPLMGRDAIEPFVSAARDAGAGVLVLVRTSNPGAADVEDLSARGRGRRVGAGGRDRGRARRPGVGERGPERRGGGDGSDGARAPGARARADGSSATFLLPGVGAQGGARGGPRAGVRRRDAPAVSSRRRAASPNAHQHERRRAGGGGARRGRAPARGRLGAVRSSCVRGSERRSSAPQGRASASLVGAPRHRLPFERAGRWVQSQDDHHGHAQRGDRQVALGAELPARPASPHGRTAHDRRRQGREHRAHPEGARPAGDRHRLRRRSHGHAHRRAAHRGVDPQRLRAHPRGVAHEHLGARPDHRAADRDQRTRSVGLRAGGRAVPRQAALPRARRRDRRVRRLASARGRARHLRGADPRARAHGGHDRHRHRRRAPAPGRARRAGRRLAERARGRGARRPRVRRRAGALAGRARDRRARSRARRS